MKTSRTIRPRWGLAHAGILAVACTLTPTWVFAQHSDIAVFQDASGIISTHSDDPDLPFSRVFVRSFDFWGHPFGNPSLPKIFTGDDPGFAMNGASPPPGYAALPGSTILRANVVPFRFPGGQAANLFHWDGLSANVQFGPVPSGHTLNIRDKVNANFLLDGSSLAPSGLTIGVTSSNGGMHEHPAFRVDDNDNNAATDPQRGFYFFGLELEMTGLQKSAPVFVAIHDPNVSLAVEEQATQWIQNNLSNFVVGNGLPGDFDGNGLYECSDIDGLVAAIAGGGNPVSFDMNADGIVNLADLDQWRSVAGAVLNASGGPVLTGDGNLDGVVDGSDFGIWNGNKFTSGGAWCRADFNADGVVDGSDFGIWNGNKFTSADSAPVPEPLAVSLPMVLWIVAISRMRPAWNRSPDSKSKLDADAFGRRAPAAGR